MLAGPPRVGEALDPVHGGHGLFLVGPCVGQEGGVDRSILNYCERVWEVSPVVKPDYYKKESSRTRSRSFPHLSYPSHSDESVGLGI